VLIEHIIEREFNAIEKARQVLRPISQTQLPWAGRNGQARRHRISNQSRHSADWCQGGSKCCQAGRPAMQANEAAPSTDQARVPPTMTGMIERLSVRGLVAKIHGDSVTSPSEDLEL
jgi:hypothetical protein